VNDMSFDNAKKQLDNKQVKLQRFLKFCAPKKRVSGRNATPCR